MSSAFEWYAALYILSENIVFDNQLYFLKNSHSKLQRVKRFRAQQIHHRKAAIFFDAESTYVRMLRIDYIDRFWWNLTC